MASTNNKVLKDTNLLHVDVAKSTNNIQAQVEKLLALEMETHSQTSDVLKQINFLQHTVHLNLA